MVAQRVRVRGTEMASVTVNADKQYDQDTRDDRWRGGGSQGAERPLPGPVPAYYVRYLDGSW